jgi:hypothetical protein
VKSVERGLRDREELFALSHASEQTKLDPSTRGHAGSWSSWAFDLQLNMQVRYSATAPPAVNWRTCHPAAE